MRNIMSRKPVSETLLLQINDNRDRVACKSCFTSYLNLNFVFKFSYFTYYRNNLQNYLHAICATNSIFVQLTRHYDRGAALQKSLNYR